MSEETIDQTEPVNDLLLGDPQDYQLADNATYVDSSEFPPPAPAGKYQGYITHVSSDKWEDGKLKQFVLTIARLEGKALRFQTVSPKSFDRNGVRVSMLGDLIRGIDRHARFGNPNEALAIITNAIDQRTIITFRTDWEAYDEVYSETLQSQGITKKEAAKKATIRGMRRFPALPDGTFNPMVVGPSGLTIPARDRVVAFLPQETTSGNGGAPHTT